MDKSIQRGDIENNTELINLALNIVQKNDSLQLISRKIESLKANPKFKVCYQELYELQSMLRQTLLLDMDRENLQLLIHEKNQLFYSKLNELYPRLTNKEIRLTTLVRLNLSSKEIASILNISIKSVEMNRYRLRKKMQISSKVPLNEFIRNLF